MSREAASPLSELAARVPSYATMPDLWIPDARGRHEPLGQVASALGDEGKVLRLAGARADCPDGWPLTRISVTEPVFTLRLGATNPRRLRQTVSRVLAPIPDVPDAALARTRPA